MPLLSSALLAARAKVIARATIQAVPARSNTPTPERTLAEMCQPAEIVDHVGRRAMKGPARGL
jgi:hypothetical protein